MKRALLRNVSLYTRKFLIPSPSPSPILRPNPIIPPYFSSSTVLASRFCSSSSDKDSPSVTLIPPETITSVDEENTQEQDTSEVEDVTNQAPPETITLAEEEEIQKQNVFEVEDVSNQEYIKMVNQYLEEHGQKGLSLDDDEEDDYDEMSANSEKWLVKVNDRETRSERKIGTEDFERDMLDVETDSDIDDLYDTKSIVMGRLKDTYLNMDDTKWDHLIKEHTGKGYSEVMQLCEQMVEDITNSNKLLPVEVKNKVEEKFEELGAMCERGELEADEAYELFKKFEDEVVNEYNKTREVGGPPQSDETVNMGIDEPPGDGPILRWQTRVVFAPGKSAWHPKNRKVKLSVTVKELGLSKYQSRRLRALVGDRYHPGRDELTINSGRFEHREENRKDCLRKLFSLIEEAAKADELVDDARASYVKERLRANPAFMERLNAKIIRLRGQSPAPA